MTELRSNQVKYVVISPVKDEEAYIQKTLASMIAQTVRPMAWVIVNDGSTDRTREIIAGCRDDHAWIKLVDNAPGRSFREPGRGVIEAFYVGFNLVKNLDFDFVVKLDGDLGFEAEYFEQLFARFAADPKLGIASGSCYALRGSRLVLEKTPRSHTRGPSKVYRRECWDDIGGLVARLGWDGIDEVQAQMRGWRTRSYRELRIVHYRPTGYADGAWKGRMKEGLGAYFIGYHPLFMAARILRNVLRPPYVVGALAMLWGFLLGYFRKLERFDDRDFRRYLRHEQMKRLFTGDRTS